MLNTLRLHGKSHTIAYALRMQNLGSVCKFEKIILVRSAYYKCTPTAYSERHGPFIYIVSKLILMHLMSGLIAKNISSVHHVEFDDMCLIYIANEEKRRKSAF